jgi:hypothetical protein
MTMHPHENSLITLIFLIYLIKIHMKVNYNCKIKRNSTKNSHVTFTFTCYKPYVFTFFHLYIN